MAIITWRWLKMRHKLFGTLCILTLICVFIIRYNFIENEQTPNRLFFVKLSNNSKNETKLVFSLSSDDLGYANRVYNVLTSLTVAFITNRDCLISFEGLEDYIDLKTIEPNIEIISAIESAQVLEGASQGWVAAKSVDLLRNTTIDNKLKYLKYVNYTALFFEICSNPNYFGKLLEHNLVTKQTTQNALEYKTNSNGLESLLRVGFEVGGSLLKRIWKFKPKMQAKIKNYLHRHFGANTFVIGIHLRFDYLDLTDIEKFTNCALEIEKELVANDETKIKWFIATDSASVVDSISSMFRKKTILTTTGVPNHIGIKYKLLPHLRTRNIEKALLDIEILSHCDEIIATAGSTFSFLAAMKRQKLPFYVNGKRERLKNCERMTLSQSSTTPNNFSVF
jgi:hypothetical protein